MATTKKRAEIAKNKQVANKKPAQIMPENIWEKLPGENTNQYAKFCAYRDMAYQDGKRLNKRSLRKLATQLNLSTARPLETLSKKFDWVSRCEAYDLELDRRAREAQEMAIVKMREDHAAIASQMIRKATKRLLTIPEEEISTSDIVRMVDVGVKIERLSRGEATENQHISGEINTHHQESLDLSKLSDEDLHRLAEIGCETDD